MNELSAILDALAGLKAAGQSAVLATLVSTAGSSYRRPGARMLMLEDGTRIGTISAGCLENDLADRARGMPAGSPPALVTYDLSGEQEAIFGYGLGCKGGMTVLLERIEPASAPDHLSFESLCLSSGGAVVTIYASSDGSIPVGGRLVAGRMPQWAQSARPSLAAAMLHAAEEVQRDGRTRSQTFTEGKVSVDALVEAIRPPVHLLLCGAADHAMPVARIARLLGWRITVHDRREKLATAQRFPEADAVLACPIADLPGRVRLDDRTVAAIMNHNYADDLELLRMLLPLPLPYIGLLGSRQRSASLLDELSRGPHRPTLDQLQRLHTPVGLDIGAETPEEIALAVIAEIQATLAGRPGTPLGQREGAIHAPAGKSGGPSCGIGQSCS